MTSDLAMRCFCTGIYEIVVEYKLMIEKRGVVVPRAAKRAIWSSPGLL